MLDDKNLAIQLKQKMKNGESVSIQELIFIELRSSELVDKVVTMLNAGKGFLELKALGLAEYKAMKVISIFNASLDVERYETELAFRKISSDPLLHLPQLLRYFTDKKVVLPNFEALFSVIRSDVLMSKTTRNWFLGV